MSLALTTTSLYHGATTHAPAWILRTGVMAWAICNWPTGQARLAPGAIASVAGLLAAYSWGMLHGTHLGLSVQPWASLIMAMMAFVALRAGPQARRAGVQDGLLAMAAVHSLWALGQSVGLKPLGDSRATGGFFSPIDLAAYLSPWCIWATYKALSPEHNRKARRIYGALAVLLAAGLWTTRSRAGILALIAALGVGLWVSGVLQPQLRGPVAAPNKRLVGQLLVLGFLGVMAASAAALRHRFSTAYDADAFSRLHIWRACLRLWAHNPMGLGTGELDEAMRLQGVRTAGAVHFAHVANNAHNTFLQTAVECGAAGALAWSLFLSITGQSLWRMRRTPGRGHLAVATALFVPALTATAWQLSLMAFVLAVWAAEVWPAEPELGQPLPNRAPDHAVGSRSMWTVVAVAVSALLLPSALSHLCLLEAGRLATARRGADAVRLWTERATAFAPWSVHTALLAYSLRILPPHAPNPLAQAEALVAMAERYPHSPEPLRRAAELVAAVARTRDQHTQAATLWQLTAERDPHNALYWMYAAQAAAKGRVPTDAPALYAKALAQEPHCAGAWLGVAEESLARGDAANVAEALGQVQTSLRLAVGQQGFAYSVLALDAEAQIRFNRLMQPYKEPA